MLGCRTWRAAGLDTAGASGALVLTLEKAFRLAIRARMGAVMRQLSALSGLASDLHRACIWVARKGRGQIPWTRRSPLAHSDIVPRRTGAAQRDESGRCSVRRQNTGQHDSSSRHGRSVSIRSWSTSAIRTEPRRPLWHRTRLSCASGRFGSAGQPEFRYTHGRHPLRHLTNERLGNARHPRRRLPPSHKGDGDSYAPPSSAKNDPAGALVPLRDRWRGAIAQASLPPSRTCPAGVTPKASTTERPI